MDDRLWRFVLPILLLQIVLSVLIGLSLHDRLRQANEEATFCRERLRFVEGRNDRGENQLECQPCPNAGDNDLPLSVDRHTCPPCLCDTAGYSNVTVLEPQEWLFPLPDNVAPQHHWRYKSTGLYWGRQDNLYRMCQALPNKSLPPPVVSAEVERVCQVLASKGRAKLCSMFRKCYPNTLETTTRWLDDVTTYVITGDIPLMWMRDSSAQVNQYLPLAGDSVIQCIIAGVIRRQIKWIKLDPYGSSFRLELDFDHKGKHVLTEWDHKSGRTIHVAMHNWEPDSLSYFLRLSYRFWKASGISEIFDVEWREAANLVLDTFETEMRHDVKSGYVYPELPNSGLGSPICPTGMIWAGFRPSDDKCEYHFHVPDSIFAVVALNQLADIASEVYRDPSFASRARSMAGEIDSAIHRFAIIDDPEYGQIFAYEVDGCGKRRLMDDANVPSLLSIPYLEYKSTFDKDGKIAANTRRAILSSKNPYYFQGTYAGIGSPHTGPDKIWHMSLIMQALTSNDPGEINHLLNVLEDVDAGTNLMHESFSKNNPSRFTRSWFAWANSLFSELILAKLDIIQAKVI